MKLFFLILVFVANALHAEPIPYDTYYPNTSKPSSAIILLHSSGGYKSVANKVKPYADAGFVVYTPGFFKPHGITTASRFQTWPVFRQKIDTEFI